MKGVINNIQSPDKSNKTHADSQRPQSPLVGEQAKPPSRVTSPQTTKDDTNILVVDHEQKQKSRKKSAKSTDTFFDEHEEKPSKFETTFYFFRLKISFLYLAKHLVENQV